MGYLRSPRTHRPVVLQEAHRNQAVGRSPQCRAWALGLLCVLGRHTCQRLGFAEDVPIQQEGRRVFQECLWQARRGVLSAGRLMHVGWVWTGAGQFTDLANRISQIELVARASETYKQLCMHMSVLLHTALIVVE